MNKEPRVLGHTLEPSFAILLSLCFFSRGFSSFSSCRGFSCGCGLLATASASCLLLSLGHVFIKVYEFDEAHLRGIACAETSLDDAGVATGTVKHLHADFAEKLCNGNLVLKIAEHYAT